MWIFMRMFHSLVIGKGTPMIFLPAVGFSGVEGLNIAEYLADDFECHLLDLPGIGKSEGIKGKVSIQQMASWLKEYIDKFEMKNVTLIGHSMGGGLAMCFASVYPEYVRKLVVLDQGHIRTPRFPIKDFGPLGFVMPIISILETIFGDKLIKRFKKFFIQEADNKPSEITIEKNISEFCERFKLKESNYIKKALSKEVNFTGEGLRFMFGYYRLNSPKILESLMVPRLLIYASFQDIDAYC